VFGFIPAFAWFLLVIRPWLSCTVLFAYKYHTHLFVPGIICVHLHNLSTVHISSALILLNLRSLKNESALGKGTVRCLNAAAGFLKKRAVAAARAAPRADGLTPQRLSGMFRFRVRCELQAAIMRGNGLIGAEVGL
jgi:hypothetical protein